MEHPNLYIYFIFIFGNGANSIGAGGLDGDVTVRLPPTEDRKVLQCWMMFDIGKVHENRWLYYFHGNSKYQTKSLEFLGKEDNSCSVKVSLKHWSTFSKHFYPASEEKIRILTVYECRSWYMFDWMFDCQIEATIDFNPQTYMERLAVGLSKIEISWNVTTNKDAVTILTPSAESIIQSCVLRIGPAEPLIVLKEDRIYYGGVLDTISSEKNKYPGLDFVGVEDNSCSMKVRLNDPSRRGEKVNSTEGIFNKTWTIVEYYPISTPFFETPDKNNTDKSRLKEKVYQFFMMPKVWWINNNYTNLFMKQIGDNFVPQYF